MYESLWMVLLSKQRIGESPIHVGTTIQTPPGRGYLLGLIWISYLPGRQIPIT